MHTPIIIAGTIRALDGDGEVQEWRVGSGEGDNISDPTKKRRFSFEPMPEAAVDETIVDAYGFVSGEAYAWADGAPYLDTTATLDGGGVSVEAGGGGIANLAVTYPTPRSGGENMRQG